MVLIEVSPDIFSYPVSIASLSAINIPHHPWGSKYYVCIDLTMWILEYIGCLSMPLERFRTMGIIMTQAASTISLQLDVQLLTPDEVPST